MKTSKNRLMLDYKDMPDLQAALGGLEPGERCKVEFELMVVKNDDASLEGDIEQINYESPEIEDDGDDSAEPSSEEPVMVIIAKRNTKYGETKNTKTAGKKGSKKDDE